MKEKPSAFREGAHRLPGRQFLWQITNFGAAKIKKIRRQGRTETNQRAPGGRPQCCGRARQEAERNRGDIPLSIKREGEGGEFSWQKKFRCGSV